MLAAVLLAACSSSEPGGSERFTPEVSDTAASSESVRKACSLEPEIVARIWRGHDDLHSEDVTIVPHEPNFWGSFDVVSHSGPWDYLQTVPLVLYGPRIAAQGARLESPASIVDVYPTLAELLGVTFKQRTGEVLSDALATTALDGAPKLIVTFMWDGVGRNMLARWPDRWPNLARLEAEGTSYAGATVGSSPSITPATHASLATGAYPRHHKVTAIDYRISATEVRTAFAHSDPKDLKLTTYADQFDKLVNNKAVVGLLAWRDWHIPMLGHGAFTSGGDHDQLALIGETGKVKGNPDYYSTPDYMKGHEDLFSSHVDELDRADGQADGKWRGHDIVGAYEDNPAYVRFQGDLALRMLRKGRYGANSVPDMFFANFKQTDIAGHQYTIDSPEVADVLFEQDRQLGRILRYLDREVGDYVLVLSADHGHTPDPLITSAWPIDPSEFRSDAYRYFKVPSKEKLFESTTAAGPFLNRAVATRYGVTARQLARFMERYTIRDNWPGDDPLPAGYRDRGDEPVLDAAWAAEDLDEVVACTFGDSGVPTDL